MNLTIFLRRMDISDVEKLFVLISPRGRRISSGLRNEHLTYGIEKSMRSILFRNASH